MSPSRRSATTYRPKRDRREVTIAAIVGAGIIVFTVVMVWILGPHDSGNSSPTTTTVPAATSTTTAGSATTTTAGSAATTTTPPSTAATTTTK